MKNAEFIATTRALLAKRIFIGRSSKLEESIARFCDALEKSKKIKGSTLSAKVTAGWWAHAQQSTQSEDQLNPTEVWQWLFDNIGHLANSIYKKDFKALLTEEFTTNKSDYSDQVIELWNDVFADHDGPKLNSPYRDLNFFIDDLPDFDKDNILAQLNTYINRIISHKTVGAFGSTSTDFTYGFNFFVTSQAANRKVNYSIAIAFKIQLNTGKSLADVFSQENIDMTIKQCCDEMVPARKGHVIRSNELNAIIQAAKEIVKDTHEEENSSWCGFCN